MEEKLKAVVAGILISSVVCGSILLGKYVFLLDSVFGPEPKLFNYMSLGRILFDLILFGISKTFPWIYPKFFIFISVFLCFISAYIFLEDRNNRFVTYIFSSFYALNPFVYNRLIAGQVLLVFSYALFPLLIKLVEKSSRKRDILAGLLISFGILQLHFIPFAIFITFVFKLREYLTVKNTRPIKSFIIIFSIVLISNAGILYQLAAGGEVSERLRMITTYQSYSFGPSSEEGLNYLTSLASLHGFWRQKSYLQVWYFLPMWFIPFVFVLYLTVLGYVKKSPNRNIYLTFAIVGMVLGAGVRLPLSGNFFLTVFGKIPFLLGYRDSQKFIVFLILSYLYLGSRGLESLPKKIYPIFIIMLLYGYPMFFGFQGQVGTSDYPSDWYIAKGIVGEEKCIFFPWHRYMDFSWVQNRNKRIENPAGVFFANILISKDPEMKNIPPPRDEVFRKVVESLMKRDTKNLRELGIKYVILGKETDYSNYLWLLNQTETVLNKTTLYLLRIE